LDIFDQRAMKHVKRDLPPIIPILLGARLSTWRRQVLQPR